MDPTGPDSPKTSRSGAGCDASAESIGPPAAAAAAATIVAQRPTAAPCNAALTAAPPIAVQSCIGGVGADRAAAATGAKQIASTTLTMRGTARTRPSGIDAAKAAV